MAKHKYVTLDRTVIAKRLKFYSEALVVWEWFGAIIIAEYLIIPKHGWLIAAAFLVLTFVPPLVLEALADKVSGKEDKK